MSDELEKLSNVKLGEAFVREVLEREVGEDGMMREPDSRMGGRSFESWVRIPPFATSADCVLRYASDLLVRVIWEHDQLGYLPKGARCNDWVKGTVFARCLCIALIRVARAKKGRA